MRASTSSAASDRSMRPNPARSSYPGCAPTWMPSTRQRRTVAIVSEGDPACTPHATFALSTQARIASSSPAPSPMSAFRFMNLDSLAGARPGSYVFGVAVEQLDRVAEDGKDRLQRFRRALHAARNVEDERVPSDTGDPAGERRRRSAGRAGVAHELAQPRDLVV